MQEKEVYKSMASLIRGLGIAESCVFPVERMAVVRVRCSEEAIKWRRRYKTGINREARTITVTRVE